MSQPTRSPMFQETRWEALGPREAGACRALLLMADPDQGMLARYLPQSRLFLLWRQGEIACVAAVVSRDRGDWELKNLATAPQHQRQGLATAMLAHLDRQLQGERPIRLWVGTGDASDYQLRFYQRCGFVPQTQIPNFFVEHYPQPVMEDNGRQCIDMILLSKELPPLQGER